MPTGFSVVDGSFEGDDEATAAGPTHLLDFDGDAELLPTATDETLGRHADFGGFFRADGNGLLKIAEGFRGEDVLTCALKLLAPNTCRCKLPSSSGTPCNTKIFFSSKRNNLKKNSLCHSDSAHKQTLI
jgi:hypothetical protein